jgi:hypothetical protein
MDDKDNKLIDKIRDIFDSVSSSSEENKYPTQALPLGTFVRSKRFDRLGILVDAFYGDYDADNKKIIIYTILMLPKKDGLNFGTNKKQKYYLTNEYEYDIIGYLMINPIDVKKLSFVMGEEFYYED